MTPVNLSTLDPEYTAVKLIKNILYSVHHIHVCILGNNDKINSYQYILTVEICNGKQ